MYTTKTIRKRSEKEKKSIDARIKIVVYTPHHDTVTCVTTLWLCLCTCTLHINSIILSSQGFLMVCACLCITAMRVKEKGKKSALREHFAYRHF